jgi:hypothetical protein
MTDTPSQLHKVKRATRELETADHPERFRKRRRRTVKHMPMEKQPG